MRNFFPLVSAIFICCELFFPQPVYAHAFGKLYNLPVPFWLYLYGGAVAIVISFLAVGYFLTQAKNHVAYHKIDLSQYRLIKLLVSAPVTISAKIVSLSLFILAMISGLLGVDSSYANFNMTWFWIFFVLGLTYLSALAGDIFQFLSPWKIIVDIGERLFGQKTEGIIKYPAKISYLPGLVFYFIFIWVELLGQITPFGLSNLLVAYSIIVVLGVLTFGKDNWFRYGEFFNIFFTLVSHLSIIEQKDKKIYLRPPFLGLLKIKANSFYLLLFILLALSSTAFDGFRETNTWIKFYTGFFGDNSYQLVQSLALFLSPLVFLVIYLLALALAKIICKSQKSLISLSLDFAFTLIPITLVYNAAHYYTLLLTQGQEIIRLFSDPFGFGWDLFGSADFVPNISLIDANVTWHSQVGLILLGHIAAVYLSHIIALQTFPEQKKALFSQLPMLLLMVAYTMIGLWILSQPISV